jgi:hypothetical protein
MSKPDAFFLPDGDDRFVATEHDRGPWSGKCHDSPIGWALQGPAVEAR